VPRAERTALRREEDTVHDKIKAAKKELDAVKAATKEELTSPPPRPMARKKKSPSAASRRYSCPEESPAREIAKEAVALDVDRVELEEALEASRVALGEEASRRLRAEAAVEEAWNQVQDLQERCQSLTLLPPTEKAASPEAAAAERVLRAAVLEFQEAGDSPPKLPAAGECPLQGLACTLQSLLERQRLMLVEGTLALEAAERERQGLLAEHTATRLAAHSTQEASALASLQSQAAVQAELREAHQAELAALEASYATERAYLEAELEALAGSVEASGEEEGDDRRELSRLRAELASSEGRLAAELESSSRVQNQAREATTELQACLDHERELAAGAREALAQHKNALELSSLSSQAREGALREEMSGVEEAQKLVTRQLSHELDLAQERERELQGENVLLIEEIAELRLSKAQVSNADEPHYNAVSLHFQRRLTLFLLPGKSRCPREESHPEQGAHPREKAAQQSSDRARTGHCGGQGERGRGDEEGGDGFDGDADGPATASPSRAKACSKGNYEGNPRTIPD